VTCSQLYAASTTLDRLADDVGVIYWGDFEERGGPTVRAVPIALRARAQNPFDAQPP